MDTNMALLYATLVHSYLELQLCKITTIKYHSAFAKVLRQTFNQFSDDCFLVWSSNFKFQ